MIKPLNIDETSFHQLVELLNQSCCFKRVMACPESYLNTNAFRLCFGTDIKHYASIIFYGSDNWIFNLIDLDLGIPLPIYLRIARLDTDKLFYFEWLKVSRVNNEVIWNDGFSVESKSIESEEVFNMVNSLKTKTELLFNLDLCS